MDGGAAALTALGRWARDQLPGPVIGITGSTGKTSTKDLLGAVLRTHVPAAVSERSYNNELGVPLTLFNAEPGTRAAVLEVGARGFGHIAWLCDMARPGVGVVTNVSAAHTEMLGSVDGVAKAKAELPASLPASGTVVLNAEDERVAAMAAHTEARVVTFGVTGGDVRAASPALDDELRVRFRLVSPWGEGDVRLEARHVQRRAALHAALAVDVPFVKVVEGLEAARLSPWRMQVSRTAAGAFVVNDAYNANPASMTAALEALARAPATRRAAIVGPMLELGDVSDAEHERIGELARRLGVRLIAVGAPAYRGEDVGTIEEALAALGPIATGDAVLVKASRAAGLEKVAGALGAAW